jgi:hydrogenase maturation protease
MTSEPPLPAKLLVIGIGNAYRCDDAVGLIVAGLLKGQLPQCYSVFEHSGEGTSLMELWTGADRVIVVDAVRAGDSPGAVSRFDATHAPLPATMFRDSTHTFSLVEAIELSRALNQLPRELIVYGVEGQDFEAGTNLSPAVQFAINHVMEGVLQDLRRNDAHVRHEVSEP